MVKRGQKGLGIVTDCGSSHAVCVYYPQVCQTNKKKPGQVSNSQNQYQISKLGPEGRQIVKGQSGPSGGHWGKQALDARLDIHDRGFQERQRSAFFVVRVSHPNADSYRDLTPKQIYKKHENEKKRQYAERVMEIEQGTFTPLVFTTTGGMGDECVKQHSRLAVLIAIRREKVTQAQFPG